MKKIFVFQFMWSVLFIGNILIPFQNTCAQIAEYPIVSVRFTQVYVYDTFWAPKIETNRTVTIPAAFKQCEITGRIDNFAIAGKLKQGIYKGERYNDTDVYKIMEGAAYSLAAHPDAGLEAYLDSLIFIISAAQEDDGYLFTARTAQPRVLGGIGEKRWSELGVSHELYCAGHMYEAAVAYYQATGKRTFLDIAIKNADLIVRTFGPDKLRGFPGHQEIELGLVKLYRVTGKEGYLKLAKYFLDQRGKDIKLTQYPPNSRFAIYNDPEQIQAHKPVLEQEEAVGHAVRMMYMLSGMTDIAALYNDSDYKNAVNRLWENIVYKKMYLTGGVGARSDRERFGDNYELPNLTAYNETCAAIGNIFWNYRMFLLYGESRYIDVMERVLYNGFLSGVSLSGDKFFYPNPLESNGRNRFNKGSATRQEWFGVACCPGNIARFMPAVSGYIYAHKKDTLYVNLFMSNKASIVLANDSVLIEQKTRYPWDGTIGITISPNISRKFTLCIRIPGWTHNQPVPGDLYRYLDTRDDKIQVLLNGKNVEYTMKNGYAVLNRNWNKGDEVQVALPMPVRRIIAHPAVKDDDGKIALEYGPLVYCFEGLDNENSVLNRILPDNADLSVEYRPDLLGGVSVIKAVVSDTSEGNQHRQTLMAIPYYAWSNRGASEMTVWLKRGIK